MQQLFMFKNLGQRLVSVISNLKYLILLLALYAIAIAGATFLEKYFGSEFARIAVYNNIALYVLLAIIVIGFTVILFKMKLWQRKRFGSVFIHSAFIIILIGALISHLKSDEGYMHLREGETSNAVTTNKNDVIPRTYAITLNKFEIDYYEGSEFPSAYRSYITISKNGKVYNEVVEVNKIVFVDGDRIYQSGYDSDKKGSVLMVNTNIAGSIVTYLGYFVLLIGFILSFAGKSGRIKEILRLLTSDKIKIILPLLFAFQFIQSVEAGNLEIGEKYLIPSDDAEKWERIYIQSMGGLVEPMECHARTILRKLTRSNGKESKQWGARVYMSILTYPEHWSNVPILYCNSEFIYNELGLKKGEYIAYNQLFDNNGNYKLDAIDKDGNNIKELQKLDEKARIFGAVINGSFFKIFPTECGKWVSPLQIDAGDKDSIFIASTLTLYVKNLRENNGSESKSIIEYIESFQKLNYGNKYPSSAKTELSIFYSKAPIFKISAFAYMLLGVVLCFLSFKYLKKTTFKQQIQIGAVAGGIVAFFMLHTAGILLRWYVSGQPPWSNTYETMLYVAWSMTLCGLLFIKRQPLICGLSAIMAATTLFMSMLNWLDPVITPLVPVLNSRWLIFHVTLLTAGYGFLGICAVIGICTLLITFSKKSFEKIAELSLINEFTMYIGLMLITAGTFIGAVWADQSWGRYWGWDAKESWALVTILTYAIVTHIRLIPKWRNDIVFASLSVYALSTILMTYFGVNYYFSGLHSYGNSSTPPAIELVALLYCAITIVVVFATMVYRKRKNDYK